MLKKFSVFDLVIIALMGGLGIAVKSVMVPLAHIITGPLFIPGGTVAGGIYMMFIVLSRSITNKFGASTLTGFIQSIMVFGTGIIGNHGILSIITYTLPGLACDLVMLPSKKSNLVTCFLGGIAANMMGLFAVNRVFFELPLIPLLLSLAAGALAGGIGGVIAFSITKQIRKTGVLGEEQG